MDSQGLLLLIASLPNIIIGLFILARDPSNKINLFFSLFAFSTSLWAIGLAGYLFTDDTTLATIWAQSYYIAASLIAISFAFFSIFYTSNNKRFRLKHALATVPPIVLIACIANSKDFLVSGIIYHSWGKEVELDPIGYAIYTIYFTLYVGYGFKTILRKLLRSKGAEKVNLKYIFIGLIVAFSLGMFFNLILPFIGNYQYIWAGPLFTVAYVMMISYAIIKHGLFDIRLAVVRTLAYILSLATLGLLYAIISLQLAQGLLGFQTSTSENIVNISTALLLAFMFQPVKKFFDKATDRIFFKDQYDTNEFIERLGNTLIATTDLRNLLQRAANEIGTTLKAEQAFFYVQYAGDKYMSAGTSNRTSLTTKEFETLRLDPYISKTNGVVITEKLHTTSQSTKILTKHSLELLMPINRGKFTLGYLALGGQRSGGYKERDIRTLEAIAGSLLIAIQNSLSTQEVRDTNAHLNEKIKEATNELTKSNAELKKLDKSKDEFLSLASHQLRTPLTSIKGYLSMVLDGDLGPISDNQAKALRQSYDSSQRMVFLINDFLNVSRLQTGRFEIEKRQLNLATLATEEVNQLADTATAKQITLSYQHKHDVRPILGDENKLRQVMMNFIDNAMYYSPAQSTIKIELYEKNDTIIFKVIDAGIGVPASEQQKLFTKFFRATNARKQRPDGTGIGLYMAKKVINGHGGELIFESTEGKGSTFGFILPINTPTNK